MTKSTDWFLKLIVNGVVKRPDDPLIVLLPGKFQNYSTISKLKMVDNYTAQFFCRPVFSTKVLGLYHFIKNKIVFIRVLSQSNMSRFRFKSDTDTKPDAN